MSPPGGVGMHDTRCTNNSLADVFRHHHIGIPIFLHYPLVVGKPPGEVAGFKFQDRGHICLCCRPNRDARSANTFIDARWSDIVIQFSDEIEAAFAAGPAACLEERPRARQVGWHSRPEIGESAIAQLYLFYPSLFERGERMIK